MPPTPRARTIQVYLYKYTSVRRSSPGKLCVGSPLGMCVLDHPWETMSWITRISPGKLCVVSFGPQLLGPQPWFPVLGRQGPWPLGPVCVASPLGNYVLDHSWETMCWITPWCVGSQCSQTHRPSNKKHTRGHVGQSKPGTLS